METEVVEKKKRGCGFWTLVVLGVIIGMAVIGAIFGPSEEEMEQMRIERETEDRAEREQEAREAIASATAVTATELFNAFSQNEVAAKRAFGDRALLITGTIDSVTLDFMDEPVVSLQTPNQFMSVQLDFDKADVESTSRLRAGNRISALCNELSEVAGTPMLDDCVLKPVGKLTELPE